jgi:hypothetical protein
MSLCLSPRTVKPGAIGVEKQETEPVESERVRRLCQAVGMRKE